MEEIARNSASGDEHSTRMDLIEAAGRLFAQKGYAGVSVREICKQAGTNSAAINYHFGGKKPLFLHVLTHAFKNVPATPVAKNITPEEALGLFVRHTLSHILLDDASSWKQALMLKVMHEDAALFQEAMHTIIQREFQDLRDIVAQLVPANTPLQRVRLICFSILGQCLFYHHNQTLVGVIDPTLLNAETSLNALCEHITQFNLTAIRGVK